MYNAYSWSDFLSASGGASLRYADIHGNYYIYATVNSNEIVCIVDKTESASDASDFETNYKDAATNIG